MTRDEERAQTANTTGAGQHLVSEFDLSDLDPDWERAAEEVLEDVMETILSDEAETIHDELERVLLAQALARIERHLAELREANPLREVAS